MPVTLAEAKNNASTDLDTAIIDEFTKSSDILNRMTFDDAANPTGGGSAIVYGYRRQTAQRAAAFRAINAEYTPANITTTLYTVELKPLGGSFEVDRVTARIGAAATGAVTANLSELIKQSRAKFADACINGDDTVDTDGFDGLSVILTGSTTEYDPLDNGETAGYLDWTAIATKADALEAIAHVDNWLALLDEAPDVIYGNRKTLALFKVIAAWADQIDMHTTDAFGRPVPRYNGIPLVDLKTKSGSNTEVIALYTADADEGGAGGNITNLGDLYAVRYGLDAFHGAAMAGDTQLLRTWLPDFSTAGAVKTGECEMGPVAPVLKSTKSCGVLRKIKSAA
jgi:hypothetical protein